MNKETIKDWLKKVYEMTELEILADAISVAKMYVNRKEEAFINELGSLYRAECSGDIGIPINLREFYKSIIVKDAA